MNSTEPQIFLIDDDDDVRTALSRTLKKRGKTVIEYESAESFLEELDREACGCLILDYGLPKMDGLQLQAKLLAEDIALPIIFITGHGGVAESVKAMRAGAIDFLEKPFRLNNLLDKIEIAFNISHSLHREKEKRADIRGKIGSLTGREKELLDYILANPARVTSKEIAQALDISPRTVDIHRGRVMQKMNVKTLLELVQISDLIIKSS